MSETPRLTVHIEALELSGFDPRAGSQLVEALREALDVQLAATPLVDRPVHIAELELAAPSDTSPARLGAMLGSQLARRLAR
jgi:hypothetical protein